MRGFWTLACAIALGACLLRWPAFGAGLHSDDYLHAAMVADRFAAPRAPVDLYDFGGVSRGDAEALRDVGFWPWWSAPDLSLAMFRPLSSALTALEQRWLRDRVLLWHAHSALWLVAWLLGAAALFRLLLTARAAVLALLLLAVDPCSSVPLAWLANRNALISCALGTWGVAAYVHATRSSDRSRAVRYGTLAAAALGLAVLAGEYAIALLPAIAVYEQLTPPPRRIARAALVLSPALLAVALGIVLGYGARSSGAYVSPLSEPGAYLTAVLERVPALAADAFAALPSERGFWPAHSSTVALQALAVALAVAVLLWAAGVARGGERLALGPRFFLTSALAGLPLLAGALPEPRLLLPIAVVVAGLIAHSLEGLFALSARGGTQRVLAGLLGAALLVAHLGGDAVRSLSAARLLQARSRAHTAWALRAPISEADAALEHVVIAARDYTTAAILPYARRYFGLPAPRRYRVLSIAQSPHRLTRTGASTLELRVLGSAKDAFAGSLHRSHAWPFAAGDALRSGALRVTVLETQAGQPVAMRFEFPEPLEAYRFMHPYTEGLRALALPALGQTLDLPAPRAMKLAR